MSCSGLAILFGAGQDLILLLTVGGQGWSGQCSAVAQKKLPQYAQSSHQQFLETTKPVEEIDVDIYIGHVLDIWQGS